jgi:hypothetical protein
MRVPVTVLSIVSLVAAGVLAGVVLQPAVRQACLARRRFWWRRLAEELRHPRGPRPGCSARDSTNSRREARFHGNLAGS